MARLAVGVAGGIIGSAVGLPGVGFALGNMLGGVLFPGDGPPDQVREGQRIQDSKIQNSAYGVAKPVIYGTIRVSGNIIWAGELVEVVNETSESVGGKGGGSSKITNRNYLYYRSFAIAICQGEISSIRKVWANGKVVYDFDTVTSQAAADGITFKEELDKFAMAGGAASFSVYYGTETQAPDSIIEGIEGAGNTPAYRGLAYVVFEQLELTEYGNTIPSITFEVVA